MTITVQITDTFEEWRLKNNALSQNFSNLSNNVYTVNVIASGNITAGGNIFALGNTVISQDIVGAGNLRLSQDALITGNVTAANIRANVHYQTHVTSKPAINVTFTGNITGSSSVALANSGSNQLTISANVAADSVTLGTHTIGDYVKSISSADTNNVIVSSGSGEGSTPTVNLAMTAVTPAIYGNSSVTPSFTVDRSGRITAASNNLITPHYLDVTNKPSINVNFTGNITGSSNIIIANSATNILTISANVAADSVTLGAHTVGDYVKSMSSADTANIIVSSGTGEGSTPTLNLAMTAATPGSYGNANAVPQITVDRSGRITSTANLLIDRSYSLTTKKPSVNLKFTGDVTGTANLNLSNENTNQLDVTLTMNADSIELGTDTTGRYTANVLPGTSITVSGTADEGNAITVNHADTSALSGLLGSTGLANITVDGLGHITAVNVANYLTDTVTTTAASYGNANVVSQIVLDTKGRVTSAANVAIDRDYALTTRKPSINLRFTGEATGNGNITISNSDKNELSISMTVATIGSGTLPDTAVSPGTYGGSNVFAAFTVDSKGRLTAASNVAMGDYVKSISSADSANIVVSNGTGQGSTPTVNLAMTAVTPGSYGNASVASQITVDRAGRVTSASNVKITPLYLDITNKPAVNINFTGDVTGKANVNLSSNNTNLVDVALTIATNSVALGTDTTGNYTNRVEPGTGISATGTADEGNVITVGLTNTAVTPTTYGNATIVPVFTVDQQGRITSASNVSITAGGSGAIGICNSNNLTSTTLTTHPNIAGACHNFFAGCDSGKCITSGNFNTFFGRLAGVCNTSGCNNFFAGHCAGYCNLTANNSVMVGHQAGKYICAGGENVSVGNNSSYFLQNGCRNVAIGSNTGVGGSSSCENTSVGYYAGYSTYAGVITQQGTLVGAYAGCSGGGFFNTAVGYKAGTNVKGCRNISIGALSGGATASAAGCDNISIGYLSGVNISTGACNFFGGWESGCCTTSGRENIFLGTQAGKYNTSGCFNLFFGTNAGRKNTTANFNVFMGYNTGYNTCTGGCNTFVGACAAGYNNTTGTYNSFFGVSAGNDNTTGCLNSFFGSDSGYKTTVGVRNTFAGFRAGCNNTSGNRNISLGHDAGGNITTGNDNIVFGYLSSCVGLTSSTSNVIVMATGGIQRFEIDSNCNNIMMGTCAGNAITTGSLNFFAGQCAGARANTSVHNTFIGSSAGLNTTIGSANFFVGTEAGCCNTTGGENTFLGYRSGRLTTTGSYNTFIGSYAGSQSVRHTHSIAIGKCANAISENGCCNIFMGLRAGRGSASTYTPINTIALGADSLSNAAQCTRNSIFIGVQSGVYAEETDNVIAIGTMSASGTALAFTANLISIGTCTGNTDSDSIYIGTRAGFCAIGGARQNVFIGNMAGRCNTSGSNNLFFGCNAGVTLASTTTESNRIVMGNGSHTLACIQVAWSAVSDIRDKCVFGPVPHGRGFLANVNPITYSFKNRETDELTDDKKRYGFSAQEILALEGDNPVLVGSENSEKLGLTTDYLVPILVNAVKEMSEELKQLRAELEELKKRV